jgi:hypothetical protein
VNNQISKPIETPPPIQPLTTEQILQRTAEEIATQMTIIDSTLFKAIPTNEFLFKAFTKPETSPKFTEMAERFNQVILFFFHKTNLFKTKLTWIKP